MCEYVYLAIVMVIADSNGRQNERWSCHTGAFKNIYVFIQKLTLKNRCFVDIADTETCDITHTWPC